jgi:hypothetical protein
MTPDRWFTLVVSAVTFLLGGLLARHYYQRSNKLRKPTFILGGRELLSSPRLLSASVKMIHGDVEVGANGITHAQLYFWNAGNSPILKSEVLEQYALSFPVRILHASLVKSNRDVVGIHVSASEYAVTIDFAVLEPGDGATLYIVYDGPANATIEFKGACLGSAKPTVLSGDPIYLTPKPKRLRDMGHSFVTSFGPLLVLVAVVMSARWAIRKLFGDHGVDVAGIIVGTGFIILLASAVVFSAWYQFKRLTSPGLPPDVKP